MVKGLDLSTFNEVINWEKLVSAVDFVIIRAGYGAGNIDKRAKTHINNAIKYNVPFGVYWFSYALNNAMAEAEARHCIKFLKDNGYRLEYPIYFDFEYDSSNYCSKNKVAATPTFIKSVTETFCNTCEDLGYFAGVYANKEYADYYGTEFFKRYSLWYSQYGPSSLPRLDAAVWQYTSSGTFDFIKGNVDCNYCYVDFPKIIKENGFNGYKKQTMKCDCTMGCIGCECHLKENG